MDELSKQTNAARPIRQTGKTSHRMQRWRQLSVEDSADNYEAFRGDAMCCSAVFLKRDFDMCRVCGAQHSMTDRRLKCASKTCSELGRSRTIWKVFVCSAQDTWTVWVNEHGHIRGVVPCGTDHPARITPAMKVFLAEQDEIGIPPRLILVHLRRQFSTLAPASSRALPTLKQIRNALKRIRREQGTKNSRKAIQQLVRLRCFRSGMSNDDAFLFGSKLDGEGYAYVGNSSDEDPFIIGISSLAMIDACLRFSTGDTYCQSHADATFKVSGIGYPLITCGFTDKSRSYQVGAFFVVSRRTSHEYAACFRSFVELVRDIRGATLKVDAVMGDAEDAQYNSFTLIPLFSGAKMLMCFFHVLYNVRKRVQHLPTKDRLMVMTSIIEMHYSNSAEEFEAVRDQEFMKWRQHIQLSAFVDYFCTQWLQGRYWQWQSYHTPRGFPSTNNPCENLNGGLKSFLQRRRFHMRKLLLKLCDFIETITPLKPVADDFRPQPTTDIVKAAAGLIEAGRVQFEATSDAALVRVMEIVRVVEITSADPNSTADEEEAEYRSVFDTGMPPPDLVSAQQPSNPRARNLFLELTSGGSGAQSSSSEDSRSSDEEDTLHDNHHEVIDENQDESYQTQKDLYEIATKWSLRRAHLFGMPHHGWWVDLDSKTCKCRYFAKFLVCAHLVAAQRHYNLSSTYHDPLEKLNNRIKANATTKRNCSKQPKSRSNAKTKKPTVPGIKIVSGTAHISATTGRPPRTSSALSTQDI